MLISGGKAILMPVGKEIKSVYIQATGEIVKWKGLPYCKVSQALQDLYGT